MSAINRIGVLTGGGDCPGINAVLRAVTKTAIFEHNAQVIGIEDGFAGLIHNRTRPLSVDDVSGILLRGGTILGTNNRANPLRYHIGYDADGNPTFRNALDDCFQTIEAHRLDALIMIGGDGTMACTLPLLEAGVKCIGVPKTIDNDVMGTEITFGFLTASATATEALDRLHSTADSHHRVMVCEIMGRNAGWLSLHSGVASGSDVILIPEIPFNIENVCRFVEERSGDRRGFSVIACSEGARMVGGDKVVAEYVPESADPIRLQGIGKVVADEISSRTGLETRTTVLGHVQRGGQPIAVDRLIASHFGHHAIELLMAGASGRMVVRRSNELSDIDIREVAGKQRLVPTDHSLIRLARAVRTCFGDS